MSPRPAFTIPSLVLASFLCALPASEVQAQEITFQKTLFHLRSNLQNMSLGDYEQLVATTRFRIAYQKLAHQRCSVDYQFRQLGSVRHHELYEFYMGYKAECYSVLKAMSAARGDVGKMAEKVKVLAQRMSIVTDQIEKQRKKFDRKIAKGGYDKWLATSDRKRAFQRLNERISRAATKVLAKGNDALSLSELAAVKAKERPARKNTVRVRKSNGSVLQGMIDRRYKGSNDIVKSFGGITDTQTSASANGCPKGYRITGTGNYESCVKK